MTRVAVIGGGAGGCMAAYGAASSGACVTLFERNLKLGKKIYITGKGRCNLTNSADLQQFLASTVRGSKFLYSALSAFSHLDTLSFFNEHNCPLKGERGGRFFPLSDKSSDVIKALERALKGIGVQVLLGADVDKHNLSHSDGKFYVNGDEFNALILACGGMSYPSTGSDGSGYGLAKYFNHSIFTPVPALCEVLLKDEVIELAGLSLKNVCLKAFRGSEIVYSGMGEMLFTHGGISGPLVLSLSSYINRLPLKDVRLELDLKPALTHDVLDARILRDFAQSGSRQFKNSLNELLPKSLISYIINASKIPPQKGVAQILAHERASLVNALKHLSFFPKSLAGFESAIVTSGGVDLSQISPQTMESKLCKGLYFAGEMLDVDALTGGYNLQIAFSTGFLAGVSAAREKRA